MSEIALYNTLRKIPDVSDEEAKEAAADVASNKEVATKTDIKGMVTKTDIAELETRMTWKLVVVVIAIVGLIKYL